MRQTVRAGGEIEALTPEEASSIVAGAVGRMYRPSASVRDEATGTTDANGNVEIVCLSVKPGQLFKLCRIYVTQDGVDAAHPFTGVGAMVELLRNGLVVAGFPCTTVPVQGTPPTSALPISAGTGGDRDSIVFTNGDTFSVRLSACNVGRSSLVRYNGWLEPLESLPERDGHRHHR